MSQRTETICDQCGARKGETNHWWKCESGSDWITVSKNNGKSQVGQDMCSEQCVTRALSEFLSRPEPEVDHYREVGMNNG